MRHVLPLLHRHRHILMKRHISLILPKMQKCWMKFASCPYMVYSAPKIDWHLRKTRRDVLHSRQNRQEECTGVALLVSFACSDIFKPDFGANSVEGCVYVNEHFGLSALKCGDFRWTILWYCPKGNSTSNDLRTFPLFWNLKTTMRQLVLPVNGFFLQF